MSSVDAASVCLACAPWNMDLVTFMFCGTKADVPVKRAKKRLGSSRLVFIVIVELANL